MKNSDPWAERGPSIDTDPQETREWMDALASVIANAGPERAVFLVQALQDQAAAQGIAAHAAPFSAYRNTIPLDRQGPYPGDLAMEERVTAMIRWNAGNRAPALDSY